MDPLRRAQIILLCDLCKTAPLQSHCELCHINLCVKCVDKHLSDSSEDHNVVPYVKHMKSTPNYQKCPKHAEKHCQLYCENCNIPVCSTCVSSGKHKGHDISDVLEKIRSKTHDLQNDLQELETRIYPRYQELTFDVENEKVKFKTNYWRLATTVDEQGEVLHREITAIVNQRKSDIAEMENKHLAALNKNTDEITNRIAELRQIIEDLRKMLNSNDVSLISTYNSKNSKFRQLPPKIQVTLPSISPQKTNTGQLIKMFGSLSPFSIAKKHIFLMKTPEALSYPDNPLRYEPRPLTTIDSGYKYLHSVSCLSDEKVWICGYDKSTKLFNLSGELLKSIQRNSGNRPEDIAVTRDGDLVYSDMKTRTVNKVTNKQIQTVITLQEWIPLNVFSTSCGDLLVTMVNDERTQSKVVRYSSSTEKQNIQFDGQGRPLFSPGSNIIHIKYINENRNLDICVADTEAKAVVVVNQSGKLRFRSTGHPSNTEESFAPVGITTDNQSQILTSDPYNNRIHILDQDGQLLRYIHNCGLNTP